MHTEPGIRIWYLYCRLQRKAQFCTKPEQKSLYKTDLNLLSAIWGAPNQSVTSYAEVVNLELSVVSRIVQKLERLGFISTSKSGTAKYCSLLQAGRRAVSESCEEDYKLLKEFSRNLSRNEVSRLEQFCSRLGSDLKIPKPITLPLELPPRYGIRYLVDALSSLSKESPNSVYSEGMLQILTLLSEVPIGLSIERIAKFLHAEHRSVCRSISALTSHGLLSRSSGQSDKRMAIVQLTPQGLNDVRVITEAIGARIQRAFRDSEDELFEFAKVLEKFAGASDTDVISGHSLLHGTMSITHKVSRESHSECAKSVAFPLAWQSQSQHRKGMEIIHTHIVSLSVEDRVMCTVLLSESKAGILFTHVFSVSGQFSGLWADFTMNAIQDTLLQRAIPIKQLNSPPSMRVSVPKQLLNVA